MQIKQLRKDGRGAFIKRQRGKLLAVAWNDKKVVTCLSTCHSTEPATVVRRREKARAGRDEVPCPQQIADYNVYMGGVDRHDQLRRYLSCNR